MAISFDASSESHTGTVASVSESSFSWTHTPVGSPKGVLVFTFVSMNAGNPAVDDVTAVTYGGVSLTTASADAWRAKDDSGESGDCKAWLLCSNVPSGPQTVTVTRNNTLNTVYAVAITVISSQNSDIHSAGVVLNSGDQLMGERNVTDGSSGTGNSLRFAGINSGLGIYSDVLDDPLDTLKLYKGSNSTTLQSIVLNSTRICAVVRETTAGTGSRPVGFVSAASDDVAAVHLALKDVASCGGGTLLVVKDLIGGFGVLPFAR